MVESPTVNWLCPPVCPAASGHAHGPQPPPAQLLPHAGGRLPAGRPGDQQQWGRRGHAHQERLRRPEEAGGGPRRGLRGLTGCGCGCGCVFLFFFYLSASNFQIMLPCRRRRWMFWCNSSFLLNELTTDERSPRIFFIFKKEVVFFVLLQPELLLSEVVVVKVVAVKIM